MSTQTEAVTTAAADLTHAMSRLVKAIDDIGDDGEAIRPFPQTFRKNSGVWPPGSAPTADWRGDPTGFGAAGPTGVA